MGEGSWRGDRQFDSEIDLHDRQHFEVAFHYDVSPGAAREDGRVQFQVDAFFFLPTNLGVSALSYGKDDFFKDVFSYLRFKTPTLSGAELADPLNPFSPLAVLSFNLKQLIDRLAPDPELERSTTHEAKLLGCILIANWRSLRREARELGTMLGEVGEGLARDLVQDLLDRVEAEHGLLKRYRVLLRSYRENHAPPAVIQTMQVVDEYLTYRFDENVAKIHEAFEHAGETAELLPRFLLRLGHEEADYRHERGYLRLTHDQPEALELYTYRTGAMKKFLGQVLFLDVQTVREQQRVKAMIAAFGAGLAAFWSTLGDRNVNFRLHGVSTTLLIAIIVLVYVLKDRIKEYFRESLALQVQRMLPDQRLTIRDPLSGQTIGTCRQSVRYEAKPSLSADVRRLREYTHSIDLDEAREEEVLSYRHSMTLEARTINATHARQMHVKHLLRYSVANLLRRLSDPFAKVVRFDDEEGRFEGVWAPKVYHVNVVFRVARRGNRGKLEDPVYHRLRVVLSKDGIVRLEPVVQNQLLWELDPQNVARQAVPVTEAEDLSPG